MLPKFTSSASSQRKIWQYVSSTGVDGTTTSPQFLKPFIGYHSEEDHAQNGGIVVKFRHDGGSLSLHDWPLCTIYLRSRSSALLRSASSSGVLPMYRSRQRLKPNTQHRRRRRRDSTVELSRVGGVNAPVGSRAWPVYNSLCCWAIEVGDKWRHNGVIVENVINIDQNLRSQTAMESVRLLWSVS